MAERRMFTQKIVDSDAFLDMPLTTQALYFHLNMRADDDGFINNPKKIQRMIGASDDDLKLLIAKRFLLAFENGVVVIKHWRMHNLLRKDRYKPTQYQEQMEQLLLKGNGAYTEAVEIPKVSEPDNQMATTWQPNDNQMATQDRIGKDSIGEYRVDKGSIEKNRDNLKEKDDDDNNYIKKSTGETSKNNHRNHLCKIFVSNFGRQPSAKELDSLSLIYKTWDTDLCEEAIARAALNGQLNLGYVKGILNNWEKEGIKTYDDYAQRDIERRGI